MKKQIELLKKYGVTNYTIENDKITINGYLYLRSLTSADKDFLKGTTINGSLYLSSLTSADKDFLKGTTINGYLYLSSLTSADKDFLKGTTINGSLDLRSLTSADKEKVNNNVKKLKKGYNKKGGYCFFDGILNKVKSISIKLGITIYVTNLGCIAEKGKYTAHGKDVKKAIEDLRFKIISEKLKNEPIKKDTIIDVKYYRLLTGACQQGCDSFISQNNLKKTKYKASELLPILEKNNAYGIEKFKQLIIF